MWNPTIKNRTSAWLLWLHIGWGKTTTSEPREISQGSAGWRKGAMAKGKFISCKNRRVDGMCSAHQPLLHLDEVYNHNLFKSKVLNPAHNFSNLLKQVFMLWKRNVVFQVSTCDPSQAFQWFAMDLAQTCQSWSGSSSSSSSRSSSSSSRSSSTSSSSSSSKTGTSTVLLAPPTL